MVRQLENHDRVVCFKATDLDCLLGMDHGHAALPTDVGLVLKASSKLANRLHLRPFKNAADSFYRSSDQMGDGVRTLPHLMIKRMLPMACRVMAMMAVALSIRLGH
jgi:hypothetical protein